MLLAAALSLAIAASAAAAAARPVEIPLSPYMGPQPSLQVSVDGRPARMLLDTGGGLTVVTPDFARTLGCKPWGRLTGFRMRGDRVDGERCDNAVVSATGLRLAAPSAMVFDFSRLLPRDAPPLAGSLALDAFAGRAITLDLARNLLVVETPQSLKARIRGAREVRLQLAREAGGVTLEPFVGVETGAGIAWMELDTGSDGQFVVARHVAALLGLDPDRKGGQDISAMFAGGVPVKGRAVVQDLIIDGNVGAPVLRRYLVTLDLARGRAWIRPNPAE